MRRFNDSCGLPHGARRDDKRLWAAVSARTVAHRIDGRTDVRAETAEGFDVALLEPDPARTGALRWPDGTHRSYPDAAEMWSALTGAIKGRRGSRQLVVVLADARRVLSLAGLPEGWAWQRQPLDNGRLFVGTAIRPDSKGAKAPWHGTVHLWGARNWHPARHYDADLSADDLGAFVADLLRAYASATVGTGLDYTPARTSVREMKAWLGGDPERSRTGPRYHMHPTVARFEFEVQQAQEVVRTPIPDGRFERVHYIDLAAAYVSAIAQNALPMKLTEYCMGPADGEIDPERVWRLLDKRDRASGRTIYLALAEVVTADGEVHLWATPHLKVNRAEIVSWRRVALYKATDALMGWGDHLWAIREAAPTGSDAQAALKALGVSWWGRMGRRVGAWATAAPPLGRAKHLDETWHELPPEAGEWVGPLLGLSSDAIRYGTAERVVDGEYQLRDPGYPARERYHALAAHVLSWVRVRMDAWRADIERRGGEVLFSHTDSIWSTLPVGDTTRLGRGMGGVDQRILSTVEWHLGHRYVNGRLDAQRTGSAVPGTWRYPTLNLGAGVAISHRREHSEALGRTLALARQPHDIERRIVAASKAAESA